MARCPTCQSARIVVVVSPKRRAFCTSCGARWTQETRQRGVGATVVRTDSEAQTAAGQA